MNKLRKHTLANLEKYKLLSTEDIDLLNYLHKLKIMDYYNNKVHLSSYSGLINDPVGVHYYNGLYHIMFQNCPFSGEHWNKSWGYFTSINLVDFIYHGIVITPSIKADKNGAYSGCCFIENNKRYFFYTGNVKEQDERISYQIQANIDIENRITTKKVLFRNNADIMSGHLRDPYVFKEDNKYIMILGAQSLRRKGQLCLYQTNDIESAQWDFLSIIDLELPIEYDNYMIECPNLVRIDDKYILEICIEQDISGHHHKVIYSVGKFNDNYTKWIPSSGWSLLDYGYDFYAPQFFYKNNELSFISWLGNSNITQLVTQKNYWANNLTVIRNIKLEDNKLYQTPQIEHLITKKYNLFNDFINCSKKQLYIKAKIENNFKLVIKNNDNEYFSINYENNILCIDRSSSSFVDLLNFPSYQISLESLENVQMVVDESVIEVFFNDGLYSLTLKYFVSDKTIIKTNLNNVIVNELKPLNITWINQIFTQIESE